MVNFDFHAPTHVIFGKDTEKLVGKETAKYGKKALVHFGGGSVKRSGLLDRVIASLQEAGVEVATLGGVQPNPRLSLVREGIALCKKEGVEVVLAVGGGSTIDSSKAIAVGVKYDGDVWDFHGGDKNGNKPTVTDRLPLGVVLTIPAAGSEMSNSCVITNEDGMLKRGSSGNGNRPDFAIMNPVLTYTLPAYQTACGATDILAHMMERYFTPEKHVDLTDRLLEAGMQTLIKNAPIALAHPEDYDSRAEIMWVSSLAHNDMLSCGRVSDFSSHQIEHELSARYDVAHGAGLAVIFPAWMKYVYKKDVMRFAQFAVRVWGCSMDFENPEFTALEGIGRMEKFFQSIGMPIRLPELGIDDQHLREMAEKCKKSNGDGTQGKFTALNSDDIYEIYKLAL